jgi:hypothetical protein
VRILQNGGSFSSGCKVADSFGKLKKSMETGLISMEKTKAICSYKKFAGIWISSTNIV